MLQALVRLGPKLTNGIFPESIGARQYSLPNRGNRMSCIASFALSAPAPMCAKLAVRLPCIASQPATHLIRPGPQYSETAQRRELGGLLGPGIQGNRDNIDLERVLDGG